VLSKFLNDVEVSLAASSLSSCDGPETTSLSLFSYLGRLRDGVSNLGAVGILSFGASNFGREGISNFGLDGISNFGTENDGTSTFGASIFVMLNDGISSFGTSTFGSSNFGMLSDGISTLGVSNLGFDTFRVSKLGRDGSSNSNSAGAASLISFFLSARAASGGAAPSFSACLERIQSSAAFLSAATFSNLLFFAATFVSAGDNSEAPAGASTADTESVGTDCAFSASFVASLAAFSAS